MLRREYNILVEGIVGIALIAVIGLTFGCAGGEPYLRVAPPEIERTGNLLYHREFSEHGSVTSTVTVRFTRNSEDGGIHVWELRGPLSYVSASLLFPEDTYVLFSHVKQLYRKDNAWYDKETEAGSKFSRVLAQQLSPATLPEYIPFGIGGGYKFMRKMAESENTREGVNKTDYLADRYHSVDVAFIEKRGIDGFLVSVPVRRLKDHMKYDTRVMAVFNDGVPRTVDEVVNVEIE
jgi:hypothetical protein